jgi:hypothetical protein
MRRKKQTWTPQQWIAFGNRVKHVHRELQAMICDAQHVCLSKELDALLKVERQFNVWKAKMENVAARNIDGETVTSIFYGDPLPEDAVSA